MSTPIIEIAGTQSEKVGSIQQVNTDTVHYQNLPSIASLANGGYVIAWQSDDQDGSDAGIFAQQYDANKSPGGGEFQVNTFTDSYQYYPSITGLKNGGYVITWHSMDQDGSLWGIFAQQFSAEGNPIGPEFGVNTETSDSQTAPAITSLDDGGYIIVWGSKSPNGTNINAQQFDTNGNSIGNEFQVNTSTYGVGQFFPAITTLDNGNYVITWAMGTQSGTTGLDIYSQHFDANSNPIGNEIKVNTFTGPTDQADPAIAALKDGGYIVTWGSWGGQDGSGVGVFAQQFDANSNPMGSEFQVNTYTGGYQSAPSVTSLGDGGYVITWHSNGHDIFAQQYDKFGNAVGGETLISIDNTQEAYPSITALNGNEYVITWESNGEIVAQHYSAATFTGSITNDEDNLTLLPAITASLAEGQEDLTVIISNIPEGRTLSDGVHQFTASAGVTQVNVDGWDLSALSLTSVDDYYGTFDLTLTATATETSTGQSVSSNKVISFNILPVNDAPVANSDGGYTVDNDATLVLTDLLDNDTDVDNSHAELTIIAVDQAVHGTVVLNAAGEAIFTPDSGYTGAAGFSYRVSDGAGGETEGLVSINVTQPQIPPNVINGTENGERLVGTSADESIFGYGGNDIVLGSGGADMLYGGEGNDYINGGGGIDSLFGGNGDDVLTEKHAGANSLYGEDGNDRLEALNIGQNLLDGGSGDDQLSSGGGDDLLFGGEGNDTLSGGNDDDQLYGGSGDDIMTGGSGNDTFIIGLNSGHDTLLDFVAGNGTDDLIDLSALSYSGLAELLLDSNQVGSDTVLTLGVDSSVTLTGVAMASLHDSDFIFA
ncbi:Ig-like domain-containing protein [Motiliproteus sp. MSK22-1]|uniref:Ig-like domain-containing protein n=1 Tax=Motiliproteus sp. MSK22-1 TaxID=1897630 RepID=UPI00097878D6|nr:Ig-like domain-containing protein [Motiliproteus sp. MSK22-1]OMH37537.1 hypothetical protein BGP75_09175 [Motiliproteus sp. MSK22-1]